MSRLDDILREIQSANPVYLSISAARMHAKATYSGWRGWHHAWHWRDNADYVPALKQIALEALREAAEMRAEIRDLKARATAAKTLVDLCDAAVLEYEHGGSDE